MSHADFKLGREYLWSGPSGRTCAMGKLIEITKNGLLKWENGELTQPDKRFVEVKKPLFGFGGKR